MIHGVSVRDLNVIQDDRGAVMHMLRKDDGHFLEFGEIYFSKVNPGWVKGWHLHRDMTLNYAVPSGRVRLAVYDARPDSPSLGQCQDWILGEGDYRLITIPPGIWNGFQGLGEKPSLVANCASHPHDPEEIQRVAWNDPSIPFTWEDARGG